MIAHDEHMILVVMNRGIVRIVFDLGYAVLSSDEMDRLSVLAESKGYSLYLTEMEEPATYASLYDMIGKL